MPDLSAFSCGDETLDDFFHYEIYGCIIHKYLAAYTIFHKEELIGVFTLMNDALMIASSDEKQDFLDDLQYEVHESDVDFFSQQTSYPALNIGHLGISTKWQGNEIGSIIIKYIVNTYANYKSSGCQFLTVDALNNSSTMRFYMRNGFNCQTTSDIASTTRRLYKVL